MNILIVDDSPLSQEQLKGILSGAGHSIIGLASNGVTALQIYKEQKDKIDLITLDITLPDRSGIDILKDIMKDNADQNVIMVSAMGKESVIQECLSIGAKNFITKPVSKDKLVALLDYLT